MDVQIPALSVEEICDELRKNIRCSDRATCSKSVTLKEPGSTGPCPSKMGISPSAFQLANGEITEDRMVAGAKLRFVTRPVEVLGKNAVERREKLITANRLTISDEARMVGYILIIRVLS